MVHALLVANPEAGRGSADCEPTWLRWRLESMGWRVVQAADVPPLDARAPFRELVRTADVVVALGGDGTIRRLLPYLAFQRQALAILPCGTGNDLARSLGVPLDPRLAVDLACTGGRRRIDLATVNGHLFVNVAALGISAAVSHSIGGWHKRRLGRLAYPLAAARAAWRHPTMRLTLTVHGRRHQVQALQITIANGISFGGGWQVAAAAALDDQTLDVVVVGPMSLGDRWRRWRRPGTQGMAETVGTTHLRGASCRVDARGPLAVNLDGDPLTLCPPLRVEVLPCALTVIVPAAAAALTA